MTTMAELSTRSEDPSTGGAQALPTDRIRLARREFLESLEPLRPALHRYCRRLTGNVWDAEDVVQETLAQAFARAAESSGAIERPMAWLVRIATNAYLDAFRRPRPIPADIPDLAASDLVDTMEVRDALDELATLLPPQERAALILKDVFDLSLSEIAAMLETTVGAVKAALHRGRSRLTADDRPVQLARRSRPDRQLLDAFAAAFSAYDIDAVAGLLMEDAVSDVVGMVYEVGRETARTGSLHHTFVLETERRYRAEVIELDGEPLVVLWGRPSDEETASEAIQDVLRIDGADGKIARLRWYFFCPETITEVAERLGVPARPIGYHF